MGALPSIDEVWRRIEVEAGGTFHTKTGVPLTYSVAGARLVTDRSDYPLHISDFAKALELVPIERPGMINTLVRGPGYIWAILHDARIRQADW